MRNGETGKSMLALAASGAVVCFINSNRAWGGGENWHLGAARYFAEQGCRAVLCGRPDGALYKAGLKLLESRPDLGPLLQVKPWHFGNLDFLNPLKIGRFADFLRKNQVTHVIAGQTPDMKGSLVAARNLPTKVFYRRGLAFPVKDSWLNRKMYASLDGLIANSSATAQGVLKNLGMLSPDKVRVINNAVDVAAFDASLAQAGAGVPALASWAGPGSRRFIIGNAGRLTEQKGQKYLLHMSADLKKRGFAHSVVIAGSGELEEDLVKLAAGLGLSVSGNLGDEAEVIMSGFMADMSPFWLGIDFFMLSSLWEGFGYVLAEAMLARKAVCAFNVNSMPEVVNDGENGFLLEPPRLDESDAQVGSRLADLAIKCAGEPEALKRMGIAGRRICEGRFEKNIVMDKLAAFLMKK